MANARSSQGGKAEDATTYPEPTAAESQTPAVDESEPAPAPVVNEPTKYPRSEHIELAGGMYDELPQNIAGALSLLDPNRDTFTKDEVKAAIKRFYNHKIETTEAD